MILALHTTGSVTELWLFPATGATATKPLDHQEWESGRRLADELLPRLRDLLANHGQELTDLTGILIFSGPGSFTSLRIGHTVANALAQSLDLPIVGAQDDDWLSAGLEALPKTKSGQPVWPFYGSEELKYRIAGS